MYPPNTHTAKYYKKYADGYYYDILQAAGANPIGNNAAAECYHQRNQAAPGAL